MIWWISSLMDSVWDAHNRIILLLANWNLLIPRLLISLRFHESPIVILILIKFIRLVSLGLFIENSTGYPPLSPPTLRECSCFSDWDIIKYGWLWIKVEVWMEFIPPWVLFSFDQWKLRGLPQRFIQILLLFYWLFLLDLLTISLSCY